MKQYKEFIQENDAELILPISDGQNFTFSFPASACLKVGSIVISLYFDNRRLYSGSFYQSQSEHTPSHYDDRFGRFRYGWLGDDKGDIVFRINKTFPASFKTYINDKLLRTTAANTYTGTTNHENRVQTAGVVIMDIQDTVAFTLTVFKHGEYGKASTLAHAIRNVESSDNKGSVEEQAVEDRGANSGSDGADGADLLSVTNLRPQDAARMKYSSTVAWPTAVEIALNNDILGASIHQSHDTFMCEWVEKHGDKAFLSTHDYFAHSHEVAWPKALAPVGAEMTTMIQERHAHLFKNLP